MREGAKQRKAHVDRASKLSVVRQCELLEIHRSGVYYQPRGEDPLNLACVYRLSNIIYNYLNLLAATCFQHKALLRFWPPKISYFLISDCTPYSLFLNQ